MGGHAAAIAGTGCAGGIAENLAVGDGQRGPAMHGHAAAIATAAGVGSIAVDHTIADHSGGIASRIGRRALGDQHAAAITGVGAQALGVPAGDAQVFQRDVDAAVVNIDAARAALAIQQCGVSHRVGGGKVVGGGVAAAHGQVLANVGDRLRLVGGIDAAGEQNIVTGCGLAHGVLHRAARVAGSGTIAAVAAPWGDVTLGTLRVYWR